MASPQIVVGTYTGTGAAQSITLGFKPKSIRIFNVTDGDIFVDHLRSFTNGSSIATSTAVAAVTNAVTLTPTGFSVGTDASVSESAKVFHYVAFGEDNLDYTGA